MSVVDAGDEEARALGGVVKIANVKEKETLLRAVRLDGAGGKGCLFELVAVTLREAAVDFVSSRQGDGKLVPGARSGSADGGKDALEIVERIGLGFAAVARDQLEMGVAEDDALIAVIAEDDEDGQDGVRQHFEMEERGFLRRVIGIGAEG